MPIVIYQRSEPKNIRIAWLCDDTWELPKQIRALEEWLLDKANALPKDSYVADIGYAPRDGALGGGAAVTLLAMEAMVAIGMELFLSEYPPHDAAE